jgi:hypothetical protein
MIIAAILPPTIIISLSDLITIFVAIASMLLLPFHFPLSVFEFFASAYPASRRRRR